VVAVGPGFGAELRGVTLSDVANDDAVYQAARAAFEEHSVLVFRNQDVTDDIQLALRFAKCATNDPSAYSNRKELIFAIVQPVYDGILDGRWTDSDR